MATAAAMLLGAAGVLPQGWSGGEARAAVLAGEARDKLIFRSGKIVEGEVLEETEKTVRFKVIVGSISAEQIFEKSDILKIERAEAPAEGSAKPAAKAEAAKADPVKTPADEGEESTNVYVIELKGVFGEDISQTPIRDAVKDAKKNKADYIIVVMDNDWSAEGGLVELPDDVAAFDELFRAEAIEPIFTQEIPREWENPPEIVFWIKQAMGGAAFLPFISKTIYMHPESRWGGMGNLSVMFGSMGDEVVRQKQYSLRMGHAEGMANWGGHDYRIVRAMARYEYVLSVKYEGGQPVLLERMPEGPDEYLLTDDGKDANTDTIVDRARGEGNDVLTLKAELAQKLLISKGTAETLDEVLYHLGISRNAKRVDTRSRQIMEGWSEGVSNAKRALIRLAREYNDIQVQGDYEERSRARGQQKAKLEEILRIYARYGEALKSGWVQQMGIPPEATIRNIIEQIKLQQLRDRR